MPIWTLSLCLPLLSSCFSLNFYLINRLWSTANTWRVIALYAQGLRLAPGMWRALLVNFALVLQAPAIWGLSPILRLRLRWWCQSRHSRVSGGFMPPPLLESCCLAISVWVWGLWAQSASRPRRRPWRRPWRRPRRGASHGVSDSQAQSFTRSFKKQTNILVYWNDQQSR